MNARAVLAMDAQEVRTRVRCAVRTRLGHVRFAAARPRWTREPLAALLDPSAGRLVAQARESLRDGDALAAHRALAEHVTTRSSCWPIRAARRARLAADVIQAFPGAADAARAAADRILQGRLNVLGYRDVEVGSPPDWHRDPIRGRRAPETYWAAVPYLDPAIGDHKVIWEINRHQHFLPLGAAFWLTDDRRYRDEFVRQLVDWIVKNPPLTGINWSSMLELAFRTMSWTWAVEFFAADAAGDASPWLIDLFVALDAQLSHVERNLSTYFSPNTHLSGEALALYVVSLAFPELLRSAGRAALGREVLLREAERQVLADGGHAELSSHYHRYSTDFYLLAAIVARAAGDNAAGAFERTARRQAAYLRTIADDEGRLPLIGDDDGGRLFPFEDRPTWDASTTLSAAASVFSDPSLAVRPPSAEVFWILGDRPARTDTGQRAVPWPSQLLADSGYFVSRSGSGSQLIFDAGRHGFLNGGHAHSDALSIVLTVRGLPLLVDPGTATYTMDAKLRDRHRAARMHNTVVIDDRDPSVPGGPFRWDSREDARVLVARTGPELDFAAGALCDPAVPHVRAVLALHGVGWLIVDRVDARADATVDQWWHLHPMWTARPDSGGVAIESSAGARLGLAASAGEVTITRDPDVATVSREYGLLDAGTTIRVRHHASGPYAIATLIPEQPVSGGRLRVREVGALQPALPGWIVLGFAIDLGAAFEGAVELAFPTGGQPQPDERWPQPCIRLGRPREMALCAE